MIVSLGAVGETFTPSSEQTVAGALRMTDKSN